MEDVLWGMSYINYLMLLHTTPEPEPESEKEGKTKGEEVIEASEEDARKFFKSIKE